LPTPGERLFQIVPGQRPTEILLGDDPCDIPFDGDKRDKFAVSLTTDSPYARHGIPILHLHAGHGMDLAASGIRSPACGPGSGTYRIHDHGNQTDGRDLGRPR